ncbi:MAG: hypothetical protein ORN51_13260 [Akkermansiaceae bacterium]|nr:hypothetical protein [Akkermansiaceae bacterium]
MTNSFQVHPLDIGPAIAGLSLTRAEAAIVAKACQSIRENLRLEREASPDVLRGHRDVAEAHFNNEGTAEALEALQAAGRAFAGTSESYPSIQRSTEHRNNLVIDELKPIALRVADSLHAKIREAATQVAEAEDSAKGAFSNLDFSASFDSRLQRTLDLLSEDRRKIEQDHAALHYLCSWGLCASPYNG